MKCRLIAVDLDGTILRADKSVSARTLRALRAAHEKGILIVTATGRIYSGVPAPLREDVFSRYFITINGAMVYDAREDAALSHAELPCELALRLVEHAETLDALVDCYADNWGYVSFALYERAAEYISDPGILAHFYRTRTAVPDLKDFLRARDGGVQKVQLHFSDLRLRKRELERLPILFPETAVSTSVPSNIEINICAANKGDALLALCARLGVSPAETIAFGDGTNDLSLIRAAGLGVAMGNADFLVKAAADTVCDDNEHDGAAKFIERLLEE